MYVGEENSDSVTVLDVATQRIRAHIPIGQARQALVYAANAVPTGAGTENLTRQNVGLRVVQRALVVPGAPDAKAKAVIRSLGPLDAVELLLSGLPSGGMYDAYAVQNASPPYGRVVKLAHLMATPAGTAEIAAQLEFFASGFTTVVLVRPGESPAGATSSAVSVPVLQVAAANHCSMHCRVRVLVKSVPRRILSLVSLTSVGMP